MEQLYQAICEAVEAQGQTISQQSANIEAQAQTISQQSATIHDLRTQLTQVQALMQGRGNQIVTGAFEQQRHSQFDRGIHIEHVDVDVQRAVLPEAGQDLTVEMRSSNEVVRMDNEANEVACADDSFVDLDFAKTGGGGVGLTGRDSGYATN